MVLDGLGFFLTIGGVLSVLVLSFGLYLGGFEFLLPPFCLCFCTVNFWDLDLVILGGPYIVVMLACVRVCVCMCVCGC